MANLDSPPPSTRVLATGATESGKSSALRALFAVRYPRVLVLDFLGTEWPQWEHAQVVENFAQLRALLGQLAARPAWRIVCNFDEGSADVAQLVALLGPKPKGIPFPRAAGGMTFLCDEVDLLYPLNANEPGTRSLWARGRHAGLTILAATQRLPQVHRVVSAQSQWLVICRQHEPSDLEAIARRVPPSVLEEVWKLEPFGAVIYRTDRGHPGRARCLSVLDRETPCDGSHECESQTCYS
jgi:hypothetical protein